MFQGVVHQSKIIQEVSNGRPKVKSIRGISKEKIKRKKGNLKLTNKYKILLLEKNRSLSQNITNEYNSLQSYEKSDIKTKVEVQDRADASRNEKLAYCQKTDSSGTNIVESAFKSDQKLKDSQRVSTAVRGTHYETSQSLTKSNYTCH